MYMYLRLENGSDHRSMASQGLSNLLNRQQAFSLTVMQFYLLGENGEELAFMKIFCTVVLTLSSILSSSVDNKINQS